MAAEAQRAPSVREQSNFAQRLKAFWRRIEPGFTFDRENLIERWDCAGEGRAASIGFEGFGVTFSLFIGRTPKFQPYKQDEQAAQLIRWYNGEDAA
ncbi:hypothetical protein [Sphingomonas sp. Leaf242]|uniref:hypothetical protein n=1 Tax=Sphingomonas sp. Leaf242 TaxID=1736304 RepID=UPI0007123477|nr:hypothetical protein [Sphingomonas sp. Leaf242]KQO13260.1 hypothetical protein ASF09_03150 [Sphingomonas sp. Leaf242]